MICILSAGKTLILAAGTFTLAWTHSVEKTRWEEHWIAGPEGLTVTQGAIEGSGAGMDPPPDAVLRNGAYVYTPHVPPIPDLVLAASGATGGGWTLCPGPGPGAENATASAASGKPRPQSCLILGAGRQAPIHVRWCAAPAASTNGAVDGTAVVPANSGSLSRGQPLR